MSIFVRGRKRKKIIKFSIFFGLIGVILIFIYGYERPVHKNYLQNICSFKPTDDTPSEMDLPILVIDTKGEIIKADAVGVPTNFKGTIINIYEPTSKYQSTFNLYENCDLNTPSISEDILINVRGQSSITSLKKQYSINFEVEENQKKDLSILGLPAHSKWVLNGAYKDKSLLRNYLAYSFGEDIMTYAPKSRFIEVFINDTNEELAYKKHYVGVYLLIEKIERGKDRVNIKKADERYNDISFIIARDKIKLNDTVYNTNWGSLEENFIIDLAGNVKLRTLISGSYPSSDKITDLYKEKIVNYLNEFEESLYSAYFKDSNKGYRKYIDVNSFIDFAMINEIFKNIDGGEVSSYFYKDVGGKLTAGPLWDFDLTLGNTEFVEVNEPTGFRIVNTVWFNRLFQDPYFCKMYKKRYEYLRNTIWTDKLIISRIEEASAYLENARIRNQNRWYLDQTANEDEVKKIQSFIIERLAWIDKNIDNIKRYESVLE
ncbi:MAG: CotH kinase family protein [Bacilli bacterium]|nr:CotH kinase family protein [Bacilli bacterium]MDD4719144.1 CotH kinase family protein [Bacilli bacterium]